jgi:hypothetical protein
LLTGARKETTLGVFIGQERCEAASPELHDPQCHRHGTEAIGNVRLADGQWRKAARAGAIVLWPRGVGLGVGNESRPVGTQCSRSPASDQRSQARSGVRARRYSGEADVACPGATSCARAHPTPTHFKVAMFEMKLLQILKLNRTKA